MKLTVFLSAFLLLDTLSSPAQNPLSPERLVDGYFSQKSDQNLKMLQELAGFLKAKTQLEASESEFYGATNDVRRLKRMTDEKAKNFFDGEYCSECNRPSVQIESEEPERAQLAAPARSSALAAPTQGELALDDARKLTRDNPAAVANIVKTWINGEAPA